MSSTEFTVTTNGHSNGDYTVPLLINGVEKITSTTFDVVSPENGNVIHKCSSASVEDAKAAVDAAAAAFHSWKTTVPKQRREIFLKTAEIMEKRRTELVQYLMEETGGNSVWANFNLDMAIDFIKDIAGRVSTIQGLLPIADDKNRTGMILKEPYGVVLAIAPWNAPYILGTRAVAFPIAAGNTVVFKGSELSPRVFWGIASAFKEAGLPDGVLNIVYHQPSDAAAVTSALIAHRDVRKINFTGSTAVGRIIAKLAGEHLKPVLLELGGKAPAVVWDDADLELAAVQCALGAFLYAGQICMSTERILVHRAVMDEFERRFAAAVEHIFPRKDGGLVLISPAAVAKNKKLLDDAVSKGATLIGGDFDAKHAAGTRMYPVIVKGVTKDMDLFYTESFGPSVSLIEVETEEQAIELANDTEYGLASAVFTADLRRALRFARAIETGAVHINAMTVHDETVLPHGGAKSSGYGRFNAGALEEWVRTKVVTYDN